MMIATIVEVRRGDTYVFFFLVIRYRSTFTALIAFTYFSFFFFFSLSFFRFSCFSSLTLQL